jgi:hypothetical protein
MIAEVMTIPRRFNGPPRSGNGGYVCGRLASYLQAVSARQYHLPGVRGGRLSRQGSTHH